MIRVGLLEDSAPVRDHFIHIIGEAEDMELCAIANCLAELDAVLDARPDIILTDLGLPDGSGLDRIDEIRTRGIAALVITAFSDRDTVLSALEAGANGYLLKDAETHTILDGIRVTLQGGTPLSAAAATFLLQEFRKAPQARPVAEPAPEPAPSERLTPRETELLTLFSRGHSYKSAARELGISPLTVGDHVKAIYRKLAVNSRGEAVFAAIQRGQLTL